jgi:hypothetical protein
MILNKLYWWLIKNYELGKDLEDMWRKHLKDNFFIKKSHDLRTNANT